MEKRLKIMIILIPFIIGIVSLSYYQINFEQDIKIENEKIIRTDFVSKLPDLSNMTQAEIDSVIDKRYEEIIENNKEYEPLPRTWPSSGPFKIDREKYILGEKIFVIAEDIPLDVKGEIKLVRQMNSTHYKLWNTFTFNGIDKSSFNIYFEPMLSESKNICSVDDLTGDWFMIFEGTDYDSLSFKMLDVIIPGMESRYVPIC